MTTIITESGRTKELPAHINLEIVAGLDSEGRIVVDNFDDLANPEKGSFLFGLTLCCNASDKGGEGGVYCRGCYGDADIGNYLWYSTITNTFEGLDPVKEVRP